MTNTKSILVLGLGGRSVIKILRKDLQYEGLMIAVDIDPVIIRIASEEFGVTSDHTTEIQCMDAIEYVSTNPKRFERFNTVLIAKYCIGSWLQ